MNKNKNFEIVKVSDEYIAVPCGKEAASFHGVIVLSESTAFLLKQLSENSSIDDLVDLLVKEYDVSRSTAEKDVKEILPKLFNLNLLLAD